MKQYFIGIDPGLRKTGWAIISACANSFQYEKSGIITTKPSQNLSQRLLYIYNNLNEIIVNYNIQCAGIEKTYVNSNNFSSLQLAHARAAAMISLENNDINTMEIGAKTIKKTITGSGNADKSQVAKMLTMMIDNLNVKNSDETDAIAIALTRSFLI